MPAFDIAQSAKVIIELDQSGKPLKVYVARRQDGSPLQDLTGQGKANPSHPVTTPTTSMEFHAGNCLKVGAIWYCA